MDADPRWQHIIGVDEIELLDHLQEVHCRTDSTGAGRYGNDRGGPDAHHPVTNDVGDRTAVPLHDLKHAVEILVQQTLDGLRRQSFRKCRKPFDVGSQAHRVTDFAGQIRRSAQRPQGQASDDFLRQILPGGAGHKLPLTPFLGAQTPRRRQYPDRNLEKDRTGDRQ